MPAPSLSDKALLMSVLFRLLLRYEIETGVLSVDQNQHWELLQKPYPELTESETPSGAQKPYFNKASQ